MRPGFLASAEFIRKRVVWRPSNRNWEVAPPTIGHFEFQLLLHSPTGGLHSIVNKCLLNHCV